MYDLRGFPKTLSPQDWNLISNMKETMNENETKMLSQKTQPDLWQSNIISFSSLSVEEIICSKFGVFNYKSKQK